MIGSAGLNQAPKPPRSERTNQAQVMWNPPKPRSSTRGSSFCCSSPIPIRQIDRERKAKERLAVLEDEGSCNFSVLHEIATVSTTTMPLEPASVGSLSPVPYFYGCMRENVESTKFNHLTQPYRDYGCYQDYPRQPSMTSLDDSGESVSPLTLPMSCDDEMAQISDRNLEQNSQLARSLSFSNFHPLVSPVLSKRCCFLKVGIQASPMGHSIVERSNLYFALRQFEEENEN